MAEDTPIHKLREPRVRLIPDVPVYDCHVYLSPPDEQGLVHVRAATLIEVVATGKNERDALRNIVARFKEVVGGHVSRGEPIPWLVPPNAIKPGEIQRFIPVHF